MSVRIIKTDNPLQDPAVLAVRDKLRDAKLVSVGMAAGPGGPDVAGQVRAIIQRVRQGSPKDADQAVIQFTKEYDNATIKQLRVQPEKIRQAHDDADKEFLELIRRASANIRRYQEGILLEDPPLLPRGGRRLRLRYTPIDRVGVYVPGGKGMYPSTVLMTVVPAQVAGVGQIAIACPPSFDGDVNPMVLALAGELGIDEVYRIGGAQAIAALAYGTESVRAVDKIVGPGNAFVAEAKRQVFGQVGIDCTAGPSEVFIIADDTAPAEWVAADMLAQAEHDPGSAVLVTTSQKLADAVAAAIEAQMPQLERAEAIRWAIDEYSRIIVVGDLDAACDVANDFATEHLQIITHDDDGTLAKVRNAGAIFLGAQTPVPLGDYYAGPSHVLPTGGTARFFSPLSCNDFLKASSVVRYDEAALAADAADVADFARREGLTAHARAIEIRKKHS